ncbi:MAG: hypothetical protein ABH827_03435 [bacterium]
MANNIKTGSKAFRKTITSHADAPENIKDMANEQQDASEFLASLLIIIKIKRQYRLKMEDEINLFFTQNFNSGSQNYTNAQKLFESIWRDFETTESAKIHNEKTIKEWFTKSIEKKELESIIYELEKQLSSIILSGLPQTKKFTNFLEQRIKKGQEINLDRGKFEKAKKLLDDKIIGPKDLINLINKTIATKLLGKKLDEKEKEAGHFFKVFFNKYDEDIIDEIVRSWMQLKEEDPITNNDYYTLFNDLCKFKKTGLKFINLTGQIYKNFIKNIQNKDWKSFIETKNKDQKHQAAFSDIFEIKTKETVSCEKNHLKKSEAQDYILKLPIVDPLVDPLTRITYTTLDECLQKYTEKEELTQDNLWNCEACKNLGEKNTKSFKQIIFQKLPPILIINLKRFLSGGLDEKITDPITFPVNNLDMSKYLNGQNATYNLYAIVIHSGGTGGGHYYTYAKWDGHWWKYDDSNVTPADDQIETIAEQTTEDGGPYILFYERADIQNEPYEKKDPITNKINQLKNTLEIYKKSLIKLADAMQEIKKKIG